MIRLLLPATLFLATLPALADEFPSVKDLMSEEEFRASGLHQLSNEELEALRSWLWVYTERDSDFHRRNSEAPAASAGQDVAESAAIRTHIVGEFTGWGEKTRFELANGQVWELRRRARYQQKPVSNPEVVIDKNLFGFFEMTLVESGRSIQVTRVK
jgi:hypothetical protein